MPEGYETIDREALLRSIERERLNNRDRQAGVALVNVLGAAVFAKEHIPGSINVPAGDEDRIETRFDKDKEIVVYCASPECRKSPTVAQRLADRGFTHVKDYAGGMSDWKAGGGDVARGAA